jgi:DNA-binding NarL/FixJ family response regulator
MNPITILLAEDHDAVREGLKTLLKGEQDIQIVGEAANGYQAVAFASKLCPDVVVMDISMPLLNGLDAALEIRKHVPSTKVLMLSAHIEEAYIERAKALGASGYVTKDGAVKVLPMAIREVHQGKAFFTPSTDSL